MNPSEQPATPIPGIAALDDCAREPIHRPAAIQPHGVLLVLDPADGRVLQVAGDAAALLGQAVPPGQPAAALLGPGLVDGLLSATPRLPQAGGIPGVIEAATLPGGRRCDLLFRPSEAGILLEIEPLPAGGGGARPDPMPLIQAMMARLDAAPTLQARCEAVAGEVRAATGFDRVMIYRFLPDDSGCVVAEARDPALDPLVGLHYPASDIPAQARAMYLENWLRLIPDATYAPAPLEPACSPRTGRALDMTHCGLRSVSPLHLAYLRNMGVRASMSLSLVCDGRLWGMVACHHRTPMQVPWRLRAALEVFAQMTSLKLAAREAAEDHAYSRKLDRTHETLLQVMAREEDLGIGLIRHRPNLLDYIDSGGVALLMDGRYVAIGRTPPEAMVRALAAFLGTGAGEGGVVALDRLPDAWPPARAHAAEASGVLAMFLAREATDVILWFRPEWVHTVTWGGDPGKPMDAMGETLTPRTSFAAWRETVRHAARPWRAVEVEAVRALRVSLLEIVVRRLDQVARERQQAQQRQDILLAELDHRVKNTLASVQALVRHTRRGAPSLEAFAGGLEHRLHALGAAHNLLARHRWEGAAVATLVEAELAPWRGGTPGRVTLGGPEVALKPKAALAVALGLHELAANAARFGALSVPGGELHVNWTVTAGDGLVLHWAERGGPPVGDPPRQGFGSTVLHRVLPYETGGNTRLCFAPGGLRCRIAIPASLVADAGAVLPRLRAGP